MRRLSAIVATLTLALGSFAVSGCTGAVPTSGTSSAAVDSADSLSVTVQPLGTATPDATTAAAGDGAATSGAGPSPSELSAMKKQLDAMQKELDNLSMPSDNDFSGAEGAVY